MWRVQQRRRLYSGYIEFEEKIFTWINKHKGIATKEWFESQVRYGEWKELPNQPLCFLITATQFEGRKNVKIRIWIRLLASNKVRIYHAHAS